MEELEIAQGVFKAILDKYTDPILSMIGKKAKEGWGKFKIDFDIAFRKYIKKSYDKYSKVKTILYKAEPQFIYDFFEIPNLKIGKGIIVKATTVDVVLNQSNYIVIRGTGGIGKSTLLKHFFLSAIESKELIPIFLELKDLNDRDKSYILEEYVFERLESLDCKINSEYYDYALRSGRFVFFLDGYDEMYTETRKVFTKKLDAFCDHYGENYYIIASRPVSEFVDLQRFSVYETLPFEKEQAVSLISKLNYDADVKSRFITALQDGLYEEHRSFASNPLLLSIMLLTFENYAEIPEKLHLFYANAFETLYEKHDATKTGFKREIRSKLSFDDFKRVFGQFCFITYAQGKIELSSDDLHSILRKISEKRIHFDIDEYIYDLQNALCLIYLDGLNYRFAHRSFQEYFTAFFLKELSDSDLKKTAVWLINQDPSRAAQDGVFHMLYDMTDDRFEQCVFLPIISAFEEEIQCTLTEPGDAVIFDKLFEIFVQDIHLRRFTEDNGIHLWLGMRTTEKYSFFVLEMSLIFSRKNIPYDDEANEKYKEKSFSYS